MANSQGVRISTGAQYRDGTDGKTITQTLESHIVTIIYELKGNTFEMNKKVKVLSRK